MYSLLLLQVVVHFVRSGTHEKRMDPSTLLRVKWVAWSQAVDIIPYLALSGLLGCHSLSVLIILKAHYPIAILFSGRPLPA